MWAVKPGHLFALASESGTSQPITISCTRPAQSRPPADAAGIQQPQGYTAVSSKSESNGSGELMLLAIKWKLAYIVPRDDLCQSARLKAITIDRHRRSFKVRDPAAELICKRQPRIFRDSHMQFRSLDFHPLSDVTADDVLAPCSTQCLLAQANEALPSLLAEAVHCGSFSAK